MVVYRAPWSLSLREQQSLDFFLAETKTRFPAEFCRPILKAANTEAVLAHAVISFGALHQAYEYRPDGATRVDYTPLGQFATYQYGKALRLLRAQSRRPRGLETLMPREDITLACCVLFACFESIRGCRRSTIIHITRGLNLLRQYKTLPQSTQGALVPKQVLTSLLTRLDNQLVELLGTKVSVTINDKNYDKQVTSALETMEEICAREDSYCSLDGLLNNILHDRLNTALAIEGRVVPNLPSDQGRVSRYLKELQSNFTSASTPKHPTPGEGDSYDHDPGIMQIWCILGNIYVSLPLTMFPEHVWDQYMADFGSIVSLAENYINRSRSPGRSSRRQTFSFSLGIIPPLYVVASRCRDRDIRRRAITLLKNCKRREILWDSNMATEAAIQVIMIEENGASTGESCARIHNVNAILDDEDGVSFEFERSI
ncbi:uncharacterized protein TRUGW13939_11288 [Talaromyces rugulosus]|uniref:Transcription factor domain-containing protein n=1 Tax=Talaromyces rugulosus TaxID=121627 RepID=A0A7H8RF03_TALRU|nr:uncharacterized protein TRUGW13939_11288 [Talaromyces rugulosus]QKX64115.1 hypothetical protein TRUGW13939_11288 [Talaromyces rugulosus]